VSGDEHVTTIHVAYDQFGEILSIAPEGGDVPVARPGVHVTELSVSGETERMELEEVARRFRVDVRARELVEGSLEAPHER
jgi:hypothetical protein